VFYIACKFVLSFFRFLDFMAALSAHLRGSLALCCSVAFVYAMYSLRRINTIRYDTNFMLLSNDGQHTISK